MSERVRVEVDGSARGLQRAAASAVGSIGTMRAAVKAANVDTRRATQDTNALNKAISGVNRSATFMRNAVSAIKWPALITGAGLAAQALSAAAGGAVALTGALAPLTGTLIAYPAIVGAVVQGVGVWKLAAGELTKALGGNEQALKRLPPAARAFYKELKALKPQIKELRQAAGEKLFPGLEKGVKAALKNMPAFRKVVEQTATSLGTAGQRAGEFLGSKGFGRDFEKIGGRNAQTLQRMALAGEFLFSSLRHVLVAAGPFVGWLTKTVVHLTRMTNESAKAGRASGGIAHFFAETRKTLQIVGPLIWDFGAALGNIASAGRPLGQGLLRDLRDSAHEFRLWTASARGRNDLAEYFRRARPGIVEMGRLVRDVTKAFFRLGNQPGVGGMIKQIRTELLPVLEQVIGSVTKAFGPHLIDTLVSIVRLLGDLAGTSGPLTTLVDTIRGIADSLHWMFQNVPGLRTATVTVMGAATVAKLAKVLAGGVGVGKLAAAAGGSTAGGGILGKLAGLGSKRGNTPANPLFVADVTGGGGVGGLAKKGGILGGLSIARLAAIAGPVALLAAPAVVTKILTDRGVLKGPHTTASKELGRASPLTGKQRDKATGKDTAAEREAPHASRQAVQAEKAAARLELKARDVRRAFWQMSTDSQAKVGELAKSAGHNFERIKNTIGLHTAAGRDMARRNFREAADAIARAMHDGRGSTDQGMRAIERLARQHSNGAKVGIAKNMEAARDAIQKTMRRSGEITAEGMGLIKKLMIKELRFYGLSPKQALASANVSTGEVAGGRRRQDQARGGLHQFGKPGERGPDSIAAQIAGANVRVAPGEVAAVLTGDQQAVLNSRLADMGGLSGLFRRKNREHSRTRKFARGGWLGASPAGLNPAIKSIGQWAMDKFGAYASSTVRPGDPGFHGRGAAVDLVSGNMDAMAGAIGRTFGPKLLEGIHNPNLSIDNGKQVPSSFWGAGTWAEHVSHVHAAAAGKAMRAMRKLGRVVVGGPDSPLKTITQRALDATRAGANSRLDQLAGAGMGDSASSFSGEWTQVQAQIAQQRGWSLPDWNWLVDHESGGKVSAQNPTSTAFGLGQLLDSNWAKYGGGPGSSGVEQIVAMANYLRDRYINPTRAKAFWEANGFYRRGGLVGAARGLFATASGKKKGSGQGKGQDGRSGPERRAVGLRKHRPKRKRKRRRKERILSVAPGDPGEKLYRTLTTQAEDDEDAASNLETLLSINDVFSPGGDDLSLDERGQLISRWESIKGTHDQRVTAATNVRAAAETALADLNRRIRERAKAWRDSLKAIEQLRRGIHANQEKIGKARDEIDKIKKKKNPSKADHQRVDYLRDQIHGWHGGILLGQGLIKIQHRNNQQIFGVDEPHPEKGDTPDPNSQLGKLITRRTAWGGLRDEMDGELRPGGIQAQIIGALANISNLRKGLNTEQTPDNSALTEIYKTQALEATRSLAITKAHLGTFRGMLPLLGSYSHGTGNKRVPQTGLYMLHQDERVATDPAGAYPDANRAAGGRDMPQVVVRLGGDLGQVVRDIEVMVDGKIQKHKVENEQRSRTFARGPGRS